MNLKKNAYILLILLPKGVQTKYLKLFWLKIFLIGGAPWAADISENFIKNLNGPFGILRGLGETDSWINLKSKISKISFYSSL